MQFDPPLIRARLLRRYNRFLADVAFEDGREATAHCANPGRMLGVAAPGSTVWLQPSDNPRRKLKLSWKLIELPDGHLAGIDTSVPNRVAAEALRARAVAPLAGYSGVRAEARSGGDSRFDFLLTEPGLPDAWVEVKNVHLRRTGTLAEFPDSVTARGAKHLAELARMVANGDRAVMLYVLQRTDVDALDLAQDIDPAYAAAFDAAAAAGVEMLAMRCEIDLAGVRAGPMVPVRRGPGPLASSATARYSAADREAIR